MSLLSSHIKISLKDAFDKWSSNCFVMLRSPSFSEMAEIVRLGEAMDTQDAKSIKELESLMTQLFHSGRGRATNGSIIDIKPDDFIKILPRIFRLLFEGLSQSALESKGGTENLPSKKG